MSNNMSISRGGVAAALLELLDAKEEEDLKNHKNRFSEALTTIKLLGHHFEIARTFRYQGWIDAGEWMSEFFGWGWHWENYQSAMFEAEEAIRNHPFRKVGECGLCKNCINRRGWFCCTSPDSICPKFLRKK